jgi:hypothetical protein
VALPAPGGARRPHRPARPSRPAAITAALFAYVGVAFLVEPDAGRPGELAIGAVTWLLLLALVRRSPREERAQVAALVLVASAGEVLGSLILGLYAYRRGGIPAFVPPGHGLVYIAGARLAQSAFVRAHARASVRAAAAAGAAWALGALVLDRPADIAGALAMVALLAFLARGRRPELFACMFVVVAVLELYGTRMGVWEWRAHWPGLALGMGNPPSGVAAGYCAMDAVALRLAARLTRATIRALAAARRMAPRAAAQPPDPAAALRRIALAPGR